MQQQPISKADATSILRKREKWIASKGLKQATIVCMFREIQQRQHLSWQWLHQFLVMNGADWRQTLPNMLRIEIWKNSKKKKQQENTREKSDEDVRA